MTQPLGPRQQALIEALRSGRYTQAKNRLRTADGMCCLGVACDISGIGEWEVRFEGEDGEEKFGFAGSTADLPEIVMEYFGFRTATGEYDYSDEKRSEFNQLSAKNDNGMSFADIADIIEKNADELFVEPR